MKKQIFFFSLLLTANLPLAAQEMFGLNCEYYLNQKQKISYAELQKKKIRPSGTTILCTSEARSWNDWTKINQLDDFYFERIWGWIVPDETNDYIFYLGADDHGLLYLSPDADPAHKRVIAEAFMTGWRDLTKHPVQQSRRIRLEKNKRYYIEIHHYERNGFDWCGVSWKIPGKRRLTVIPEWNLRAR